MKKRLSALLLSAALATSVFAGYSVVNAEEADPMAKITEGYYSYAYDVEGIGTFPYYFHFYEEQPVLGSVFYAGFAMNQITFAGTYTVEEKEFEYACFATREEAEVEGAVPPTGTAPYTITFYDWDGNEMDSCGFDGDILYQDMDVVSGIGAGPAYYHHDTEGEASKLAEFYEAEVGMTYFEFMAVEEETSTIALYHNGTYLDLVNLLVEGTWTMEESEEGLVYRLTPETESDIPATLTVAADKMTATYALDGEEGIAMINTAEAGPKAAMTLAGTAPIPGQDDVSADLVGTLYEDGTCTLIATAFGQEIPLDAGTYSVAEDGYTITFQFDAAGEIVSTLGEAGVEIHYVQAGTALSDVDTTLVVTLAE